MAKHNDKYFRKLIQTALQDNTWRDGDRLCDWDWLLYRIRMGGNCMRLSANLNALARHGDIPKQRFLELQEQFTKETREAYDQIIEPQIEKEIKESRKCPPSIK